MKSIQKFFILSAKEQQRNNGLLQAIFGRKSNLIRSKLNFFLITFAKVLIKPWAAKKGG